MGHGRGRDQVGTFFYTTTRTLAYSLAAPAGFNGSATLAGVGSFDGADVVIGGAGEATFSVAGSDDSVTLQAELFFGIWIEGAVGERWRIEAVELPDAATWTLVGTVELTSER